MPSTEKIMDRLFSALTLRYGASFLRQWPDVATDAIKADWVDVLGGFLGKLDSMRHALDNLPADKPPNAMQFRDACARAPVPPLKQLPSPPANPELVAKAMAGMLKKATSEPQAALNPAAGVVARLDELERGGMRLTQAQRLCREEARAASGGYGKRDIDIMSDREDWDERKRVMNEKVVAYQAAHAGH